MVWVVPRLPEPKTSMKSAARWGLVQVGSTPIFASPGRSCGRSSVSLREQDVRQAAGLLRLCTPVCIAQFIGVEDYLYVWAGLSLLISTESIHVAVFGRCASTTPDRTLSAGRTPLKILVIAGFLSAPRRSVRAQNGCALAACHDRRRHVKRSDRHAVESDRAEKDQLRSAKNTGNMV